MQEQAVRALKGVTEVALAPHDVHPVAEAKLYVPAAQAVQAIAPSVEKVPAEQDEQPSCTVATVPVASNVPAAHPWRG